MLTLYPSMLKKTKIKLFIFVCGLCDAAIWKAVNLGSITYKRALKSTLVYRISFYNFKTAVLQRMWKKCGKKLLLFFKTTMIFRGDGRVL